MPVSRRPAPSLARLARPGDRKHDANTSARTPDHFVATAAPRNTPDQKRYGEPNHRSVRRHFEAAPVRTRVVVQHEEQQRPSR